MTVGSSVSWRARLALALAVIVVVGAIATAQVRQGLSRVHGELVSVAEHRASMLEAWFAERIATTSLSATSFPQAELYAAWRDAGDLVARDRLFRRLTQFAAAGGFSEVALLDEGGRLLWSSAGRVDEGGTWTGLGGWAGGAAPGTFGQLGLYGDAGGTLHADFVAALPTAPPGPSPVVVYHANTESLYAERVARWATRHVSATVVLFQAVEGGVAGLARTVGAASGGPGGVDRSASWFLGREASTALAMRLAVGSLAPLQVAAGHDHRGMRIVGAGQEVGDTGWYVLAQVDRGELRADIVPVAALGLLLVVLAYGTGLYVLQWMAAKQRANVAVATARADAQREHTERFLAAIADASPDAIYAKDLEGRYLFVNRAGSDFVGRSSDDVVGRIDRELFARAVADLVREADRDVAEAGTTRTFLERVDTTAGERVFSSTRGPLRDAEGGTYGVFGISRDVTEWTEAQRALEEQARALAESVAELERFNRAFVDRELAMVELKRQANALARRLGEPEPYPGADALLAGERRDG